MTVQTADGVPQFTICDRLRKAREMTGLDQAQFATELGVSRGTVSNYERDEHAAFKPIVLHAWAMRTGVPLEWLKVGVGGGATNPPGNGGKAQPNALARLTDAKRRRARGGSPTIGVCVGVLAA